MTEYRFSARRDRLALEWGVITRGRWIGSGYWIADSKFAVKPLIPKRVLDRLQPGQLSKLSIRKVETVVDRYRRPFREGAWLRLSLCEPARQQPGLWVRAADIASYPRPSVPWGGQLGMAVNADFVEHIERCFDRAGEWRLIPSAGTGIFGYAAGDRLRALVMPVRCRPSDYREGS